MWAPKLEIAIRDTWIGSGWLESTNRQPSREQLGLVQPFGQRPASPGRCPKSWMAIGSLLLKAAVPRPVALDRLDRSQAQLTDVRFSLHGP